MEEYKEKAWEEQQLHVCLQVMAAWTKAGGKPDDFLNIDMPIDRWLSYNGFENDEVQDILRICRNVNHCLKLNEKFVQSAETYVNASKMPHTDDILDEFEKEKRKEKKPDPIDKIKKEFQSSLRRLNAATKAAIKAVKEEYKKPKA